MRIEFDPLNTIEKQVVTKMLAAVSNGHIATVEVAVTESAAPGPAPAEGDKPQPSGTASNPAAADTTERKKPGRRPKDKSQATVGTAEPQSNSERGNGASAQPVISPPVEGAVAQPPAATAPAAAVGAVTELSMNDVRGALEKVQAKHGGGDAGLTACRKFVADFGAKLTPKIDRISLLPKDQYRAFIDECGKAAA